ncbi:MAG: TolC family protein [Thermoguttaceae bacterium]|nr:TolC family protein [Thermoguttaceae bacterium]
MKYAFGIFILIAALSVTSAEAYTLSELEFQAASSHPALRAELQKIQGLQGKRLQAGLGPNPVLSYTGVEIGNNGAAGFQGGTISQEIVTADKLRKDQRVVDQEILAAQYDYSVMRLMVIKEVRQAAYEVMLARRTVDYNEKICEIVKYQLDKSESLYKSGQITLTDIYQVRLEMKNADLELQQSKIAYWKAWKKLAFSVGNPDLPADVMEEVLDDPAEKLEWEDIVAKLNNRSPELARAQTNYLIASAQYHAEVAKQTPNVTVEAGFQYDCASRYTTGLVTVSVPFPLRNKNQGAIAQSRAQICQAQSETESAALALQKRLVDAFMSYKSAYEQLEYFQTNIEPDLQKTLNALQEGNNRGEVSDMQLQAFKKDILTQQKNMLQIKAQIKTSEAEINAFFQ